MRAAMICASVLAHVLILCMLEARPRVRTPEFRYRRIACCVDRLPVPPLPVPLLYLPSSRSLRDAMQATEPPVPKHWEKPADQARIFTGDLAPTFSPARILSRVRPIYPHLAQMARIQGTVVLEATISKTGRLEQLHVVSGHPLLVQAALEAVNQWRYQPALRHGEPVEAVTSIEVKFTLNQ
jgi:TonB family protein